MVGDCKMASAPSSRKTYGLDSNYQVSPTQGSWVISLSMIKIKRFWNHSLNIKAHYLKHNASIRSHENENNNVHLSRRWGDHSEKMSLSEAPRPSAWCIGGPQQKIHSVYSVFYRSLFLGSLRSGQWRREDWEQTFWNPVPAHTYCVSAPSSISTFSLAWLLRTVRVKRWLAELCLE